MQRDRDHNDMTDQEWEEIYSRAEKKIKKAVKKTSVIVAVIFGIVAIFWAGIVYERDYKISDVASSVSSDGRYELILQAVGEADWPFGAAAGRLVLKEGSQEVSETDFIIHDDGGSVRESIWKVSWCEEYAEVILSGDEQPDEQIFLYFDGEKESRQLQQSYACYVEALEQILTEHTDPNGRRYDVQQNSGGFENNCFAIVDIDGDGSQELIFNFNTSYMGGMYEVVYACDEASGTLREEYSGWVDTAYYNNGLIKVSESHNHGKDPEGRGIWPYELYQYDETEDCYQLRYRVQSWDGQAYSEDFPAELDTDGDGILYYIMNGGETVEITKTVPVDLEEYETWADEMMPEWRSVDVIYHPMTEEAIRMIEKVYA